METTLRTQQSFILPEKTKVILVDLIAYLFIALFIYTATSKIQKFESFEKVLSKSVIIGHYNVIVAWSVTTIEILISVLLIIPKAKKIGLIGSLGLMSVFTIYLIYMVTSGSKLGCTCGGFISQLSWTQHIWFNLVFIMLAIIGIKLYTSSKTLRA